MKFLGEAKFSAMTSDFHGDAITEFLEPYSLLEHEQYMDLVKGR